MIKNLFTKQEHRVFSGMTKEQAAQAASWYWRSRQFGVSFTSPYTLTGVQYHSKLGLRQQVSVACSDVGQGTGVDVSFSAELTDEGAVVGVVGAVLILPVAVAVGAVSYIEYENDATRMMSDFWTYLSGYTSDPKPPPAPAQQPAWTQGAAAEPAGVQQQSQAPPKTCPSCKAPSDADASFCKHCGAKL